MATLSELKRINARLKAETEVRSDFAKRDAEKRALIAENKRLQHPSRYKFFSALGRGAKTASVAVTRTAKSAVKSYSKSQARKLKTSRRTIPRRQRIKKAQSGFSLYP